MKKLIYILCSFIGAIGLLKAQGGFNKNFLLQNSAVSVCTDAIEAPNCTLVFTGLTFDTTTGTNRLTILGTDSVGNSLWRKDYGNGNFEYLDDLLTSRSLIKIEDNFYFYAFVRVPQSSDISVIIKFDFNGDTLWQRKFSDSLGNLYIKDISKTTDNGFILTGTIEGLNILSFLIKTDANGNELWRKYISKSSPNIQEGRRVLQDNVSKKIVIAGCQANGSAGIWEYYNNIIVCDSLGTIKQRYSIPSPCGGLFQDMLHTKDGKFVAVGSLDQCNPFGGLSRRKSYVVKFDIDSLDISKVIWQRTFDTLSNANSFTTINELPNGNLILSGVLDTSYNYGIGFAAKIRLIKLDKNGNTIWRKVYGNSSLQANSKRPKSLNLTKDGGFILANELLFANNPKPYTITKIDSTGCDSTVAYCSYKAPELPESEQREFKLYPNPCYGPLFFQIPDALAGDTANILILIHDVMGKQILQRSLSSVQTELNLSFLVPGLYLFTAYKNEERLYNSKLMINHK